MDQVIGFLPLAIAFQGSISGDFLPGTAACGVQGSSKLSPAGSEPIVSRSSFGLHLSEVAPLMVISMGMARIFTGPVFDPTRVSANELTSSSSNDWSLIVAVSELSEAWL